ncbi:MAG: hypothetical protein ABIS51_02820 [Sphingomonas sp.]
MIMSKIEPKADTSPFSLAFVRAYQDADKFNNIVGSHRNEVESELAFLTLAGAEKKALVHIPTCNDEMALLALCCFQEIDLCIDQEGIENIFLDEMKHLRAAIANLWRYAYDCGATATSDYAEYMGLQRDERGHGFTKPPGFDKIAEHK